METIFTTKQFHLWPFIGFFAGWRGFYPTYSTHVSTNSVIIKLNGKQIHSFQPNEIEACMLKKTWFGLGSLKIGFSYKKSNLKKEERGVHWCCLRNKFSYLKKSDKRLFADALKGIEAKCFNSNSISLINDTLWMSSDYVIEYDGKFDRYLWALSIPELKYYYTQNSVIPFKKPILITGSNIAMKIKKLKKSDVEALKQHIISNGAKLGEISNSTFNEAWYLSVLFSPKLWFTHISIGLGDEGVTFSQKTFKTNDAFFLPYNKVNFAISTKKWYWLFTRNLVIYGEQNFISKRRLYAESAKRIVKELREKGISEFEGGSFSESYHTSGFGIILSIVTLSIWHYIVVLFSKKRKTITIGEKMMVWKGDIWLINFDNYTRNKSQNNLQFYSGEVSDVRAIYYHRKHWYSLLGSLYIWTHPSNIRYLDESYQSTQDYDLELGKIIFFTAWRIRKSLINAGFEKHSDRQKRYKKWVKNLIKKEK